jgi:hypothetical protein
MDTPLHGWQKILFATALQRSNSEQLRDIRRDPPRLIAGG